MKVETDQYHDKCNMLDRFGSISQIGYSIVNGRLVLQELRDLWSLEGIWQPGDQLICLLRNGVWSTIEDVLVQCLDLYPETRLHNEVYLG